MQNRIFEELIEENTSKIVFLVMDGLGGLAPPGKDSGTELQQASTPNMDRLAASSACGLLDPIAPGITPGSGPAHFALFGYDPVAFNIGRGVLEAAGINFPFSDDDVLARINFCTLDRSGKISDRRAGRLKTEENERICKKIEQKIIIPKRLREIQVKPVKEHRAVVAFRGTDLFGDIDDTDPQKTGTPPLSPRARSSSSEETAQLADDFLQQAQSILSDEPQANMLLLRGFAKYRRYPTMHDRFGLKSLAIASYPMYKGIARLLGMDVLEGLSGIEDEISAIEKHYTAYDFFFLHIKPTDSRGEDGAFYEKVKVIEEVDRYLPRICSLNPDVLVITGDHSTPAVLKGHSWHPVPLLLSSDTVRSDTVTSFDEASCVHGGLGRMLSVHLMSVALAHAGRLGKFGA